jgi:hypothetical protein
MSAALQAKRKQQTLQVKQQLAQEQLTGQCTTCMLLARAATSLVIKSTIRLTP